jgi:hypothetical protein
MMRVRKPRRKYIKAGKNVKKLTVKSSTSFQAYSVGLLTISFLTAIVSLTGSGYIYTDLNRLRSLNPGDEGTVGVQGSIGYDDSYNETILDEIVDISEAVTSEINSFDFGTQQTCLDINSTVLDISGVITNSGLTNFSFLNLVEGLQFINYITGNGTFCLVDSCTLVSTFTLFYAPLVGNGTNGTETFVTQTSSLVSIFTNGTFVTEPVNDLDLPTNGSIKIYELNGSISNAVIHTDSNANLEASLLLSTSLGGTNTNSSGENGFAIVSSNIWDFVTLLNHTYVQLQLVDSDFTNSSTITGTKFFGGTANSVVINNGTGYITTTPYVPTDNGGFGADASAFNGYTYFDNGTFSFTSALNRSAIEAGTPDHLIVNNGTGYLSSIAQLPVTMGGTGIDSSSLTGFVLSTNGVISVTGSTLIPYSNVTLTGSLLDSDFSSNAQIDRSKFATGTAGHVIYNNGVTLSSISTLPLARGGTGTDLSASTGYVRKGTSRSSSFSVTTTFAYANLALTGGLVNADFSTTASVARSKFASVNASHVVINDNTGAMSSVDLLPTKLGGLGVDITGDTGILGILSGIGSFFTTYTVKTSYTPVIAFGGLTTGIVQLITRGSYSRFLNVVTVEVYIILSSKGSATGTATMTLPVAAVANDGSNVNFSVHPFLAGAIDIPAGINKIYISPINSATTAYFLAYGDNMAGLQIRDTHFTASSSVQAAFSYFVS